MGEGQSGLPLWGSFAGEGAAGGGRLGEEGLQGHWWRLFGLSMLLMLGLEVEVAAREQGGPCTWSDLHGQGGGQGGKAAQLRNAVGGRPVQPLSAKIMQGRLWKRECFNQTQEKV